MAFQVGLTLLKHRRTKIVATLGPASSDYGTIEALVQAGVNVFRLNMSHGSQGAHRAVYDNVRQAALKANLPIAVLADLSGPKIRVGCFRGGSLELRAGATVTVTTRDVLGGEGLIPSQYDALARDVKSGDRLLLDDGNLELRVIKVDGAEVGCEVVTGGLLKDKKGMNLPGVVISTPSLTDKDRDDARFALELGVDFLALSFVRRGADVTELRALVDAAASRAGIIAKIEKPEALEDIDSIVELSDAIMVARGDLGVELPPERVPLVQDELIELARARARPVIVATQMLESMIENPRPTRAEVSDVANAVRAGADAVMLSGETAAGKYPIRAVEMMDLVARQSEAHQFQHGAFERILDAAAPAECPVSFEQGLAEATARLSRQLLVRCIVVVTTGGHSARVMSASRPAAPLLTLTGDETARRQANLAWGTLPLLASPQELADPKGLARERAQAAGLAVPGQSILLVRGFSLEPLHNTPSVTILTV